MWNSFRRLTVSVLLSVAVGLPALAGSGPGSSPEPAQIRSVPRNVLLDQKWFWTRPAHVHLRDLEWLLPFSGVAAGLIAADTNIEGGLPDGPGAINNSRRFSNAAVAAMATSAGGFYLWGHMHSDGHAREAGLLGAEALAGSFITTEAVKLATRRERPLEGDRDGSFEQGGSSFPSQDAAAAWSVAEVIAQEYPRPLSRALAYGMAAAVSATRVTARRHFSSDVFVGAALGWFMGRHTFRARHRPMDDARFGAIRREGTPQMTLRRLLRDGLVGGNVPSR